MVEANSFAHQHNYWTFIEAEGGDCNLYEQGLKEMQIIKENDPNHHIIHFKYPITEKIAFHSQLTTLESNIYANTGRSFLHVFFSGNSWQKGGRLITDLGFGNFPVEGRMSKMCAGGLNLATWCVFDCSRAERVGEANVGGKEWNSDNDEHGASFPDFCLP